MATAFISHSDCDQHNMGRHHPERPERLSAIRDRLSATGIDQHLSFYDAPLVERVHLERVHSKAYVETIRQRSPKQGTVHLDPDTAMCPTTWTAALRAAGAGVLAVDLVMAGEVENAFCNVRPPGHHAEHDRAMGFCFFNNIAVAAAYALSVYQLKRVAIVDFDVHHGNGTEDIFSNDDRVLMVSTFQHPFYPYSGTEHPAKNMINVPLPAGAGGQQIREAVSEVWLPTLRDFQPEFLFISAGFDAHFEDDMAGLRLLETDYAWVTKRI